MVAFFYEAPSNLFVTSTHGKSEIVDFSQQLVPTRI